MTNKTIKVIEEKIGYTFNEKYLLIQAFTRSSFAEENQNWESNEKLEFVGDKVLDFVLVKKLTEKFGFRAETLAQSLTSIQNEEKKAADNIVDKVNFEFVYSEGEMTDIKKHIVQTAFLSAAIERLGLEEYLLMSNGDILNGVNHQAHVKEDLFEAIIGAIAIDSGWNMPIIEAVIEKMLKLDATLENGIEDSIDYVSYVNNWHQKEYGKEAEYIFYENRSDEIFECTLSFGGTLASFDGFGYSKKTAIRLAAKRAYEYIQEAEKSKNTIHEIVGCFTIDTAISKLEMLRDKKIITGLDYIFTEGESTAESDGNPTWLCRCIVDNINHSVEWCDTTKGKAKKAAAFHMLTILTCGRDAIMEDIEKHFNTVDDQPRKDNKMKISNIMGWVFYGRENSKKIPADKCGKWMYFFDNRAFVEGICKRAIDEGIVTVAKHTDDESGVACFYLNVEDVEGHKRVIEFFIKNKLIRMTKSGKFTNISFKLDSQTRNGEYGDGFKAEIKLDTFVDLTTGEWKI